MNYPGAMQKQGDVKFIQAICQKEWNNILAQFKDATIYQTGVYGQARWGESNLNRFVVLKGNKPVAAGQVILKKVPFLGIGIAYVPWGPVWRIKDEEDNKSHFLLAIEYLRKEYVEKRGYVVRITPNVLSLQDSACHDDLLKEGWKRNDNKKPYRTLLLDITPEMAELRKNLNPKWRNKLNGAEKNDLQVRIGKEDDLFSVFLTLQKEMQQRKNYVPGISYMMYQEIQRKLEDQEKMIILTCEHEGEPICSAVVSSLGDTGIYLLGATGNRGMSLKGSYLLQWKILEMLKDAGCLMYDLGGINPKENPGVYNFKSGLSGDDVNFIGAYECSSGELALLALRFIEKAKSFYEAFVRK